MIAACITFNILQYALDDAHVSLDLICQYYTDVVHFLSQMTYFLPSSKQRFSRQ